MFFSPSQLEMRLMREYSEEFKASIIAKMLPPNNVGVPKLARETGIPKDMLYSWRLKYRNDSTDASCRQATSGELSSEEKFVVVI
jgi:transposase-like protein